MELVIVKQNNDLRICNVFKMLERFVIGLKFKYNIFDFVICFMFIKKSINFKMFGKNVFVLSCFVFIYIRIKMFFFKF